MNKKNAWLRRLPVIVGAVFCLSILVAVYLLKDKFQKPPQTKKIVQQVTMIQPPPPPPPPPEQKPPEPEVEEAKIEEPEPEQEPEPAPEESNEPPAEELGLDADGSAGADGFGLAARKGGRSILGGSGGSSIIWYGGQIKRLVEDGLHNLLSETDAIKTDYVVVVSVWIGQDGQVTRSELSSSSGKPDVDTALRTALTKLRLALGKAPPENMPQPVKIRLTSKV
jgi:periplasmic protein TonB